MFKKLRKVLQEDDNMLKKQKEVLINFFFFFFFFFFLRADTEINAIHVTILMFVCYDPKDQLTSAKKTPSHYK